ncbi:MAG: xylulokinase [Thermomicrobiales bacterium]|nr:xylulokinase [Thermomicrobiales bacterium]
MAREVVLGVDSSTQSTKVVAVDLETGAVLGEGRAPHTGEDIQDPNDWWAALRIAVSAAVSDGLVVRGLAVAGQQHGCVTIDAAGEPVRPAPLWNNVASAPDADRLNSLADFATAIGTRLVASITITKLAHLRRTAPNDLARTVSVGLPHDWLNLKLTGELATDRGEASGSGWWSPSEGRLRRDLLALAVGEEHAQRLQLPVVRGPHEPAGALSISAAAELGLPPGIPVGPGTGDNMGAAIGVGAAPGEYVISLGTSGTAFAVSEHAIADLSGAVCGFADATGRFMPLACMLNCTRVFDTIATLLGIPRNEALDRAGQVEPGADGLLLVPYLAGERTPNLPVASGTIFGLTAGTAAPHNFLRAAVDGVAAGLAYCVEALQRLGVTAPIVTLVGGGSAHPTWQQAIADATGLPVVVRAGGEHCARGAATQIAAIVRGESIAELAKLWRPPIIAEVQPRHGLREAFALGRREYLIVEMRANS